MAVLSQRSARTESDRGRTRDRILAATVRLLAESTPYAELTVGEIATSAAVSRPTFYAYFRDKRDLILALGQAFERAAHEASADWLALREDDLRGALEDVFAVFSAHRYTVRAIAEAAGYDAEVSAFWRSFHERFIGDVAQRFGLSDPEWPAEAAEAQAFTLIWMTERSFSEQLEAARVSDEAMLDAVERLWRCALPAPPPAAQ